MSDQYIYDMTDTWNNGGTTYTGIKLDVTDSASASASKLLDLLIGGTTKFKVDKAGYATSAGYIMSAPSASKTANYTVLTTDRGKTIYCDASAGAFTITLPAAATATDGFEVTVVKTDASTNAVTIDGNGSETINGATTIALRSRYAAERVLCNGTSWVRLWEDLVPAPASKTGAYTVTLADNGRTILCDASSAGFTVTLPAAASAASGFEVIIVKTDTTNNAVTVDGDGSETINGATTFALTSPYAAERVQCTGSAWHRLWNPPSPGFMVTKSGNQASITAGAETKLTFDSELWDQGGVYDTGTSRATPPAGRYMVTAAAHVTAVEADWRHGILLKKNGTAIRQNYETVSTTANQTAALHALIEANGTDYFEVFVNLEGTTDKTVVSGESLTWFGMTKI